MRLSAESSLTKLKDFFASGVWRDWSSPEDVRTLALIVAGLFDTTVPVSSTGGQDPLPALFDEVHCLTQQVLCEWLGPTLENRPYSAEDFLVAVFGQPWCSLVRDTYPEDALLTDIINETLPDIVPALLQAPSAQSMAENTLDLPAIG